MSAFDLAGQSDFADTGLTTLPAAPPDFTATAGSTGITLQWNTVTGALIYNVYRGLSSGGEGALPYASGLTNPTFIDNGVNPGTTYYYTVAAADFSGEGAHSTQASATIAGQLAQTDTEISGVGSSGTLELVGSNSEFTGSTNLTNDSTATAGILVSGTNQVVGNITGTGNLVIAAGGDLTANSIVQNTLVIGAGGTLTIVPSGGSANASAAAASAAQLPLLRLNLRPRARRLSPRMRRRWRNPI